MSLLGWQASGSSIDRSESCAEEFTALLSGFKLPNQKLVNLQPRVTSLVGPLAIMEVMGGPMLRAVLRHLATAAAVRTLPTPCRNRRAGAVRGQVAAEDGTPPRGVFMGFREAVPAWGDLVSEAGSEVWDLDDGFLLPPPLLDLGSSELGGGLDELMEYGLSTPQSGLSLPSPEDVHTSDNEILHQILMERLGSLRALQTLAAAVQAGGRRFPAARPGPRVQAPKAGACVKPAVRHQRQRPPRRGFTRQARDNMRQPPRGR